ncbi:cephalosporin hydroxylase family protein [Ectopseudomonas chengduensis]|jgi:cephalosporin hydroxylase|nr:cephalosporin hydroxylase family protein [Pseudomonas chengduensis]UZT76647.1 cephalosporin hydroxylase family protein [Pseudomonas chengduensis]
MSNDDIGVSEGQVGIPPDRSLRDVAGEFMLASIQPKYSYNFNWLGRPIIQYPQDMVAMQELIWAVRPDLIIETGIAHGGSLVLSASMLALLDMFDAMEQGVQMDPRVPQRMVLGVDIDIREHNRVAIEQHPLSSRIKMIQGSSIADEVVEQVREFASGYSRVLVCLDSNHTHDHVLAELNAYASLVSKDSYCVVFDTIVEDLPKELSGDRPWGPGDNPKTAVHEWMSSNPGFVIDKGIENKLLLTVCPDGYLKRVAD